MKKLLLIFLMISLPAFANDVVLTWEKAPVFVPWRSTMTTVKEVKTDKKYPVIIYLHGCSGIAPGHGIRWGEHLSNMGFIAILPDSYARPKRKSNCNSSTREVGFNSKVHDYRQEEISYALEQLKNLEWADKSNIFLMGHSEGGFAVSQSTHTGFKGNIISGWTCTGYRTGIFSPKSVPVLTVAWTQDPWFYNSRAQGRCIDSSRGRNVTQIDLDGPFHDTVFSQEARIGVFEFLKKHTTDHYIKSSEPVKTVSINSDSIEEPLIEFK